MSEIIKLTPTEHLLKRSGMYIGNTTLIKSEEFIFENNHIIKKEIKYVPAFIKIFREILDNSVDEFIKTIMFIPYCLKVNIFRSVTYG